MTAEPRSGGELLSPGRAVTQCSAPGAEGVNALARSPKSVSSSVVAEATDASSIPDNTSLDGNSVRSGGQR